MNSLTKKLAAGVIAAATMLGIAGLGATTANADTANDGATLTVSTTDASFASQNVKAYQMFSATVNANGGAAYTLNAEWEGFFSDSATSGLTECSGKTGSALSTCAYTELGKLTTESEQIKAFATKASNWAQAKKGTGTSANATAVGTQQLPASATDGKYSVSFTGLNFGYYLVAVPGVANANADGKYATLVSVTTNAQAVTADIKGVLPTVEKKVQTGTQGGNPTYGDSTDAKVGDTLTFTLTSTIPDMSAYDSYVFNFKDKLSGGLTFGAITSVKVEGADAALTENTDYEVTKPNKTNNNTLTVVMKDFKNKQQDNTGKKITVTYTATLNDSAVIGGEGNTNSATVEYSNNPTTDGKGESTPDIVRVYTYQFGIEKYAKTDHNTKLANAEFKLEAKGATDAIKFVVKTTGDATNATVYRVAQKNADGNYETGADTKIVTPASGRVDLTGLAKGEYVLTETKAPDGYNLPTTAWGVKVDGTVNTDGKTTTTAINYNLNSTNPSYDQTAANGIIGIENATGPTLPSTGGMGTALFTVFGVLIVALGAGWYVKSNRKASKHAA